MYIVTESEIRNEKDPREVVWKCFAWMDAWPLDTAQISLFHRKTTGNKYVSDEQVNDAIDLLIKNGLLRKVNEDTVSIEKSLYVFANYIAKNPLSNNMQN